MPGILVDPADPAAFADALRSFARRRPAAAAVAAVGGVPAARACRRWAATMSRVAAVLDAPSAVSGLGVKAVGGLGLRAVGGSSVTAVGGRGGDRGGAA